MKQEEARSLFILAGFDVLRMMRLENGYSGDLAALAENVEPIHVYHEGETRLTRNALDYLNWGTRAHREPWWFVKTPYGWIEIGWRKRVILIDWTDCGGPHEVTADDVTKHGTLVHAWSTAKALEYLTRLKAALEASSSEAPDPPQERTGQSIGDGPRECICVPVTAAGIMVPHRHCPAHGTPKVVMTTDHRTDAEKQADGGW